MRRIVFVILFPALLFPFFGGGAGCGKGGETESAGLDCSESAPPDDFDCDGVANLADNCLDTYNPSQSDEDGDGIGDLCEIVPCGDGKCDPEAGECDVFDYCTKDCNRSLCFGLPAGETCGDGLCDVLAGECADSDPCIEDCPDPEFCHPFTCGDRVCQAWEDNPDEDVSFCFFDCICQIEKAVADECHSTADCGSQPGTVCGPDGPPKFNPEIEDFDFSQVACQCTTCDNGVLDEGEACDPSAGFEIGVQPCFNQGFDACDGFTCQCVRFERCDNGSDDDGDGLADCDDPDCLVAELGEELCNDCIDNDGDGLNNCDDPDCADRPVCAPASAFETDCVNGLDDDGDSLIDCADVQDCCGDPACSLDPACASPPGGAVCGDGILDSAEECDESAPSPGACGAARCVDPGATGANGEPECTCEPPAI